MADCLLLASDHYGAGTTAGPEPDEAESKVGEVQVEVDLIPAEEESKQPPS